jgi:hypothetical protein
VLMRWQGNSRSLRASADGAVRDDTLTAEKSRRDAGATKNNCKNRFLAMLGMTGQGTGIEKSERYVPLLRRWGGYLRVPGMAT